MEDYKDTGWSGSALNAGHAVTGLFTTEVGIGCWSGKVLLASSSGISLQISPQKKKK